MIRLWAGWFTATLEQARAGRQKRPLLIVLDCKGGRDAREKADRTRRLLHGAGARRVAVWPDEARLSLWGLPPRDLAVLLYQMIDTGTGGAAYYADILQAVLTLAVTVPRRTSAERRRVPGPAGRHLADPRLVRRPPPRADGPGRRGRPAPARHPASLRHPAGPARPRAGRPGHPRRRGRLVLHPGGHPRTLRRPGPGHGADRAGRPRCHRPVRRTPRHAPRRRRLLRGVRPGAAVQPVRARPVAGHRRPGLRAVLARPGRRRGRAVPDRGHRRRRDLGDADAVPGAADPPGREEAGARDRAQAHRQQLGRRGHHPRAEGVDRRPRPHPPPAAWARPATSTAARPPSSRSPGPSRPRSPSSRRLPSPWSSCPRPGTNPPPTPGPTRPPSTWHDVFGPGATR